MEDRIVLRNKKIILGVTGCIASYKSAELARMLRKAGAEVWTVMTASAQKFISPLTFRTLTGNPCITDMFSDGLSSMPMPHISLSDSADLLLIAPATANIIAKAAGGICDDVLSTLAVSCDCGKMLAPAMNTRMWKNRIVRQNLKKLNENGFISIDPENGELACGETGEGRLASLDRIFKAVVSKIGKQQDLSGKNILVTAGGTREPIDPVRFIGNRSSGRMGYAIAREAADRGANVTLISANVSLPDIPGIEMIKVGDTDSLKKAVHDKFPSSDVLVMAAAPADFRPATVSAQKIKKDGSSAVLELAENEDILATLPGSRKGKTLVGFALESSNIIKNAQQKLKAKCLDMIIANGTGAFDSDTSKASIIMRNGKVVDLPAQEKSSTAKAIFDRISGIA